MRRAACFSVTMVVLWALGIPEGFAQDNQPVLEEIVVTASRKEERLRDVPVSMTVYGAEFLAQQSIIDYQSLASYVPNVSFGGSTQRISPKIRGFGTPADIQQARSFEQAVALIIDGVPYSRSEYFQTGLFDLERVEVLRGPQGTLFGKNASVGSFNLHTTNPTDEFAGFFNVEAGELDRRRYEGGIGGPAIPEFLNFRVSVLSDKQDGYMKNTTARVDPAARRWNPERDRQAFRLKLDFPDLLGVQLRLSYERFDADFIGKNMEPRRVSENMRPFFLRYDPNSDFEPDNFIGSVDTKSPSMIDIETYVANASYDLGGWGLEATAGWTVMDFTTVGDSDLTPAPAFNSTFSERTPQQTFEGLVHSPSLAGLFGLESLFGFSLGSTDLTAGVLYQHQQFDPIFVTAGVSTGIVAEMIAFDQFGSAASSFLPPIVGTPSSPARDDPASEGPGVERSFGKFEQDVDVKAVFGQMNWHFLDRWTLLVGMRFQRESKEAQWDRRLSDDAFVLRQAGFEEFKAKRKRSDEEFAPKVGLKFQWTDDFHFFATWSRGFRAGGFNSSAVTDDDEDQLGFDAESVESWEVGAKTQLLDGAARLDVTLYNMEVTDFQLDTSIPVGQFDVPAVQNAGEVRARGVEVDGDWLATDWLTVRATMAFNDTELIEFPFGLCEQDRPNTDGDDDQRCDLSGGPLPGAPESSATLIPQLSYPLAFLSGVEVRGALTVEWKDSHFLRETLDPRTRQESFFRLDASIGLANPGSGWDLKLTVKNLTDKSVSTLVDNVSVVSDTFLQYPDPPRRIFGTFRWVF